ncbi:hypothetical protein GCM10029992_60570 [Glycomyces albus]
MVTDTTSPVRAKHELHPVPRKRQRRELGSLKRLLIHLGLIVFAMVMIYPLLWMLSASLKPIDQIFSDPSLIPRSLEWSNYTEGWNALPHPFHQYIFNSMIIVAGAIVGNLVSCSMAAYAFARLKFPCAGCCSRSCSPASCCRSTSLSFRSTSCSTTSAGSTPSGR